jgi:hypothetical protein
LKSKIALLGVQSFHETFWGFVFGLIFGKDWFNHLNNYPSFVFFLLRGRVLYSFSLGSHQLSENRGSATIHVIGDSHARTFQDCWGFVVHYVGPATAYKLPYESSTTNSKKLVFDILNKIGSYDTALLEFGEIDCRIHIYNEYMKNGKRKSLDCYIEDTIDKYGQFLEYVQMKYTINLAVLTIPPAGYQGNHFKYPFYAPPNVRAYINRMFNERLRDMCSKHNIRCIDLYSMVVTPEGFVRREYLYDTIHLNSSVAQIVRSLLVSRRNESESSYKLQLT